MSQALTHPSPNFDERGRTIELVILHYTGMESEAEALRRLRDPAPLAGAYAPIPNHPILPPETPLGRVSAHYMLAEDGRVLTLVAEDKRAWHAGAGAWRGEGDLNARSIGIEIVNGGHDFGLPPYPQAQIAALIQLLLGILARHGLKPAQVVGHSDVAPARKADPGEHFPWAELAKAGVAIWPAPALLESVPPEDVIARQLTAFGYDLSAGLPAVIAAFQRRFRPSRVDGALDLETAALLEGGLQPAYS